jgi:hypothetical protein
MAKRKKKEMSWDEIGESIGRKVEKMEKECGDDESGFWKKRWMFYRKEEGGGFGRFLFILGLLFLLNFLGTIELSVIPWWILALIIIGFTGMRF